ncbi:Xaa-Pro peptidase family protein [Bacillus sp. AFS017336]|uniref:M24 family metallopeptidase n=1 Tax=Bacillus sp. AFS017336 TaxID=2033489 RepID=UPI000BEF9D33|nr:Xaa-Pro peptidase family protein [Bacillus sp. AFS017336]PEL13998.1 peptidase M24 family protein [Bacillus sp. AFS017336]
MNNRLQELKSFLQKQSIPGGLVTSRHNIFYLSNFDYNPHERFVGIFVFPNDEPIFITPAMEVQMIKDVGWNHPILSYTDSDHPWALVRDVIESRNKMKQFAVEKHEISYFYIESLQQIIGEVEFASLDPILSEMRLVKDAGEIEILREAAAFADYGVQVGIEALKEGITELEVLGKIEFELKKKGIKDMSFPPIVLFGKNASNPHGASGENKLKKGDIALFDLGVKYKGYCSDITRTVIFGNTNSKLDKIYNTVLQANLAGVDASQPGTRIGDVDLAGRHVIQAAGYGDFFPHRIGHGLGIDIHEAPSMNDANEGILKSGMVITIEPGIYLNGLGGVRIEDDVVITENGCEVLTKFPKQLMVVGVER